MNCTQFEPVLDRLLENSLSPDARCDAEAHLQECSRCRQLVWIARGELEPAPADNYPDLTEAILGRTSGRACGRTLDLACGLVDGELEEENRQLVSLHLGHCASCTDLVEALVELKRSLPEMAELEPPPALAAMVLQATSARRDYPTRFTSKFMEKLRAWARQPRFTLEAAYVGTLLMVALLGNPATVVNKTSPYVLSMLQVNVQSAWKTSAQNVPLPWIEWSKVTLADTADLSSRAHQASASLGQTLMNLVQGDERLWEPVISSACSAARSSLDSAVSVIQETRKALFVDQVKEPPSPGRGK